MSRIKLLSKIITIYKNLTNKELLEEIIPVLQGGNRGREFMLEAIFKAIPSYDIYNQLEILLKDDDSNIKQIGKDLYTELEYRKVKLTKGK